MKPNTYGHWSRVSENVLLTPVSFNPVIIQPPGVMQLPLSLKYIAANCKLVEDTVALWLACWTPD